MKSITYLAIAFFMFLAPPVEARKLRHVVQPQQEFSLFALFNTPSPAVPGSTGNSSSRRRTVGDTTYLAHPAGCPARAFCGCGAAMEVFGRNVRELWLARAWFKFPRSAPASGTVAVRRGHVFVLKQHIEGSTWLVYDANSGGRRTRLHPRSIAGYTIVNPHA